MLKEFKEFISRGNVVDLAVGIIIGGAFGKIVNSLVNDLISPLIGILTSSADLSSLVWVIKPETIVDGEVVSAVAVNFGAFILAIIDFIIIGFAIFIFVKAINKFKRKEETADKIEEEAAINNTDLLLEQILNELKKQ